MVREYGFVPLINLLGLKEVEVDIGLHKGLNFSVAFLCEWTLLLLGNKEKER
ncbi:hypothetical protein RO3G_04492 [Rhizopus delemar RA 99-880]|uniref:Uncharacterized protein n=1 Tax=Rhizopus delemar (strain RA 99-880 / ATCC MYA-4621 / FGSC 9543 / NRRL 43880) TaxID=246409 RepID=I1BUA7_RHIO9|nr:hypothetical protein RO3G_04492 [Rhizopus delemar RA 99-880]|eukprot:EIE79787.1 hypothetical protein RO3G_04492 [Rhizopus delemar RA 99-880]